MGLDKGRPGSILGRITAMGLPYHGLVESGTLTLPSGATMPYPQPATGDVFVVRRPDWIAPTRSAEQLAADAAADHEWRDYAIIAGRMRTGIDGVNMQIGGQPVNGWIWFDPAGQAWRIHIADWGHPSNNAARVMQFNFGRFGLLGGSLGEVSRSTPAFSIAQDGAPEVQFRPSPSGSYRVLEANDSEIFHKLLDVSTDGSRALFASFVTHYNPSITGLSSVPSIYVERVVGIYEIVIAADGSVSGAALRSRADCLGTVVWDDLGLYDYEVTAVTVTQVEPPACSIGTSWSQVIAEYSLSTVTASFPLSSMTQPVRVGVAGDTGFGSVLPFSNSRSVSGLVLGAHYDALGVAQFVTAGILWTEVGDGGHSYSLSSLEHIGRCVDGVRDDDPPPSASGDNWSTLVTTMTFSISVGGSQVLTEVFQSTLSSETTVAAGMISGTTTETVTHNGVEIDSSTESHPAESFFGAPSGSGKHVFGWLALEPTIKLGGILGSSPPRPLDWFAAEIGSGVPIYHVAPVAWNETTFGLVVQQMAGVGVAQHAFSDAVSRGASVPSAQTYTPSSGTDVLAYPAGTYQPVTGQWSGAVSETPSAARCWV